LKRIRFIGLLALVGWMTACSTVETPPADDVYFWDEVWSPSYSSYTSEKADETVVEKSAQPVLEYTNIQDTTVTVRIKR